MTMSRSGFLLCLFTCACEVIFFPLSDSPRKSKCKTNQLNIATHNNSFCPPSSIFERLALLLVDQSMSNGALFLFVDKHKQTTEMHSERLGTLICESVLPASNNNSNSQKLKDLCHEVLLVDVYSHEEPEQNKKIQ